MRIAVTYEDGQIFQHFGHTQQFKFYDVGLGKIFHSQVVDTGSSGHGAQADFLRSNQVDVLICGGIGPGAQNALAQSGIKLCGGVSGSADQAVEALMNGSLVFGEAIHCEHHGHGGGHQCGSYVGHTCSAGGDQVCSASEEN
ncbi:MAG: dinitrogenase iron-molybdenum cofactor biosynthesis protein [Ruminiclostridium sp.]|nr:dinitrogenase iron-molybdenum cofactor biosynthesis protein [Ruminiclostridium sp.]